MQKCKSGRAFSIGLGPGLGLKLVKNFGHKTYFCLKCTKYDQNYLATLLNFSDLT